MQAIQTHLHQPDVSFDGGDLDCGNGLLLLIRKHIDPLPRGGLLEIRSSEISVDEDLPAWCRLTGNELLSWTKQGRQRSFLVAKGKFSERVSLPAVTSALTAADVTLINAPVKVIIPTQLPTPIAAPAIAPLSVMGIGSWPRPRWMLQAMHDHMEGRLQAAAFQDRKSVV